MSIFKITSLNKITAGPEHKLISVNLKENDGTTESKIFFLDNEKNIDDSFLKKHLSFKIKNNKNQEFEMINMFDIKDLCIQSTILKTILNNESNILKNRSEIFAPSFQKNFYNFCNTIDNKFLYFLSRKTSNSPVFKQTNLQYIRQDEDYSYCLYNEKTKVNLYKSNDNQSSISSNFELAKNNLTNDFNYVIEFPNYSSNCTNLLNGDIFGEFFTCKNVYDFKYSMKLEEKDNQLSIVSNRNYYEVQNCNNRIYLKYINDNFLSVSVNQENKKLNFQQIELIKNVNRFSSNNIHKSNMYSINVKNTNLNDLKQISKSYENQNSDQINSTIITNCINILYDKIKLDIKNNIRDITKKICPANTELFEININ